MVIQNTACTNDSPALYQGRLHTADKEKVKIENVFHLTSHCCQLIFWIHINVCASEATFVISDWTKSQPGPQIVLMKVLLLQQMTGHILHLLWWKMVWFCWLWWGSLGLSGEVGRSWRYCNARPTRDEAGASSWTSSPCKNQFNIEGGTWPPYQILSW